jgi:sulfur carrier protein
MKLSVNGQERDVAVRTLAELWQIEAGELDVDSPQGIAIAVNGEVAPRAEWEATRLSDGDRIEIVRAMRGG